MSQQLGDTQKHVACTMYLEGSSIAQLAEKYGYTYGGMLGLLRSPDMVHRLSDMKTHIEQATIRARTKILMQLHDLVDHTLTVAADLDHPQGQKAREWLMEKVWPTVQRVETHTTHTIEGEVGTQVAILLGTLNERMNLEASTVDMQRHIHQGEDAVPQALSVPPARGNGKEPATQNSVPTSAPEGLPEEDCDGSSS